MRIRRDFLSKSNSRDGRRGAELRQSEPMPAPFIVGVARSGTTLLRLFLDAHPDIAIPPETSFGAVCSRDAIRAGGRDELLDALIAMPIWPDLGVTRQELEAEFAALPVWSLGDGVRAYYRLYARRHRKTRWGDKTPANCLHMAVLAELLPEARFIHVIRDGRDVAASLRGLHFAPGDGSVEAIATTWRAHILRARDLASSLPHYREVRYERLVAEPTAVLRELCVFLELRFRRVMLRAHRRAKERMSELADVRVDDVDHTREERLALHALLSRRPDPSRIGRWRDALTEEESRQFSAIAGDLLEELGYVSGANE